MSVVCAVSLLFGADLIALFSRFVLGGLLLYLGLDFFVDWVWMTWFKLPRSDYVIIILIMLIMGLIGLLQAVSFGLIAAIALFLLNYSRINVTKYVLSRTTHQSYVQRSPTQQKALRAKGEQIYILELQGFIFFGTANQLLNQVCDRGSFLYSFNYNISFLIQIRCLR